MKRIGITLFITFLIITAWTVLLLPVGAENKPAVADSAAAPPAQTVGNPPPAAQGTTADSTQPSPNDNAFVAVEIAIALGLFVVILLAVFKWGPVARPKKEE